MDKPRKSRDRKKLHKKAIKARARAITLLMSIIVIIGSFGAISASATSHENTNNSLATGYAGAIPYYDTLSFYTSKTGGTNAYKQFSFPRYTLFSENSQGQISANKSDYEEVLTTGGNIGEFYYEGTLKDQGAYPIGINYNFTATANLTYFQNLDKSNERYLLLKAGSSEEEAFTVDAITSYVFGNDEARGITYGIKGHYDDGTEIIVNDVYVRTEDEYSRDDIVKYWKWELSYGISPQEWLSTLSGVNNKNALTYLVNNTEFKYVEINPYNGLYWINTDTQANQASGIITKDYTTNINLNNFTYQSSDTGKTAYLVLFGENKIINIDTYNLGYIGFTSTQGHEINITYHWVATVVNETVTENGLERDFIEIRGTTESEAVIGEGYITPIPFVPDLSNTPSLSAYFNDQKPYIYIKECSMYISIPHLVGSEDLDMFMSIPYDITPPAVDNWILGQVGSLKVSYEQNIVSLEDKSFISWLSDTTSAFLNTKIFGGISIGNIMWFCIGLGGIFVILKYFAGG